MKQSHRSRYKHMNHVFDQTLSRLKEKIARELTKPRHILYLKCNVCDKTISVHAIVIPTVWIHEKPQGLFFLLKEKKNSQFVMNVLKGHLRAPESEMRKIQWCHGAARAKKNKKVDCSVRYTSINIARIFEITT